MNLEEALKWADTFGLLQSDPPDGDAPALMTLAAEVRKLRNAANIALGHMTGGMDGDWADCNPVDVLRDALSPNVKLRGAALLRRPSRTPGWALVGGRKRHT